jgi:TonB family protein
VDSRESFITVNQMSVNLIDKSVLRQIRGLSWTRMDLRFILIALISVSIHLFIILAINKIKLKPAETVVIEDVPERFAKLIVEKPIPKTDKKLKSKIESSGKTVSKLQNETDMKPDNQLKNPTNITTEERVKAQKAISIHTARVERKIRTVGVLGMLTGVGNTAKGPAVVDVLGNMHEKKDKFSDLNAVLDNMNGLQKAQNIDILNRKLVKSKDISVSHKEEIDDLIASVGNAKTSDLSKKGDFIIQRPESIEGAASSNAKRDPDIINEVVASHKASIKMSYEKFLRRDPNLTGKISVRFTISASGTVSNVKILENTTGNTELEDEIIRKIKMWQFESIPEGDVTVTYPFVFAPAQ